MSLPSLTWAERPCPRQLRLQALEGGQGHAGRIGVGLQDRRGHRADQRYLRDAALAVAADVARHLPAAGAVPDVDDVMQVKVLDQGARKRTRRADYERAVTPMSGWD